MRDRQLPPFGVGGVVLDVPHLSAVAAAAGAIDPEPGQVAAIPAGGGDRPVGGPLVALAAALLLFLGGHA